ncbi:GT-D fold domain-containing glycosyltransferase [Kaistella jeonii]|uniref:Glycosyltransferase GT-D fold domain-containing protein n=1 Tax=Kaistella jeonii TaxID=266749 RepID=A0A0C1F9E6_9FLAO|nr:GT-D fold domain-containing glycosyltransferase [Kaistella jeonii]KIA88523.1 hypothetical protein OA86_10880 [Kaistella jeonii]SFC19941.1 glycosyltransferase, SP_1767 family [Kaistella jeonii]VEI97010.1 glycosyltransferase, SP_1767 family [Kaistella jeonii]
MKNYLYFIYWIFRTWPLRWSFPKYKILNFEETIDEIILSKKSISRFGDGEFRLLIKERGIYFQNLSNTLADRLNEVLNSNLSNHLVCIPSSFSRQKNLKREVKIHWLNFINQKGNAIKTTIENRNIFFGDALISRFYMDYKNKHKVPWKVNLLKKIWENQNLLIIEGAMSRLGIGNDFFTNAKSIERILCPSTNAFEKYEEILSVSKKHGKNKLIIIALGPAATILAYDLAKENKWALDLGHIDIEYSWFLQKAKTKVPVKGKKSAEVNGTESFELSDVEEKIYKKSIIAEIL